jgi:hypothetical protein
LGIKRKFEQNIASSPPRKSYAGAGDDHPYGNGYYGLNNENGNNDTQFQSFVDEPGELAQLASKEELQITTNKYPNELSLNNDNSSKNPAAYTTLKNYGSISSIDLDTIHPLITVKERLFA